MRIWQEQQLKARQLVLQQQASSQRTAASKTQRELYIGNLVPGLVGGVGGGVGQARPGTTQLGPPAAAAAAPASQPRPPGPGRLLGARARSPPPTPPPTHPARPPRR
jgi:splicing factor U2AF subunit